MMGTDQDDHAALAGAYVLGVLDPAETALAETLIAKDRGFAGHVRDWQGRLAPLDATAEDVTPSPALWQRIENAIGAEQSARKPRAGRQSASASPGIWERLEFWRWSALAGAAAALMLVVLVGAMLTRWPAQPVMIAVLTAENGQPGAIVESFADGNVRLIPLQDITVPQGRALQVWTLRDRQEGPISIGLLDRAQSIRLDLGKLPAPRTDQLFEITLEPQAGSPTGRPTGPVLMKGLTASIL